MPHRLISLFILLLPLFTHAQWSKQFEDDFRRTLDPKLTSDTLRAIINYHSDILAPGYGEKTEDLLDDNGPLAAFKETALYKDNIANLLASQNQYQRKWGYIMAGLTSDKSTEALLLKKLETEPDEDNLLGIALVLMQFKTKHTTPLFNFLVKHEDFGDMHIAQGYIFLNKDSVRQTAYDHINSRVKKEKILAAMTLQYSGYTPYTEVVLKKAVREWDTKLKGYALVGLATINADSMLEYVQPLLYDPAVGAVAFQALANSSGAGDRAFLKNLAARTDTVPEKILDCFMTSDDTENARYYLALLRTATLPANYRQYGLSKIFFSDAFLPDIQQLLQTETRPNIICTLVRTLSSRTDSQSVKIIVRLLHHPNRAVREATASGVPDTPVTAIKNVLPELIKNPEWRSEHLTRLIISSNIDTLHAVYEDMYANNTMIWHAFEYFYTFPKPAYAAMFKQMLSKPFDEKKIFEAPSVNRTGAALGLANLHDTSSVDLIITNSEHLRKSSDANCTEYLEALAMLKGEKARAYISSFINSKHAETRNYATALLKNW